MVTNGFLTSPGEIPARTRAAPEPSTSLEASLKKGEKRVRIRAIWGKGLTPRITVRNQGEGVQQWLQVITEGGRGLKVQNI